MYSLKLTKDARSDLSDIRRYTIKQFGESQYQAYRSRLEIGLQHLIEHPEIGFEVDELEAGYRCLAVQHHRIFYRIDKKVVWVVAILHESRLPRPYLAQRVED